MSDVRVLGTITKVEPRERLCFGWCSVVGDDGELLTHLDGDQLDEFALEKATYAFVEGDPTTGLMHERLGIGRVVESVFITPRKLEAMNLSGSQTGWWLGLRVTDDQVWKRVLNGELRAFSIAGSGEVDE